LYAKKSIQPPPSVSWSQKTVRRLSGSPVGSRTHTVQARRCHAPLHSREAGEVTRWNWGTGVVKEQNQSKNCNTFDLEATTPKLLDSSTEASPYIPPPCRRIHVKISILHYEKRLYGFSLHRLNASVSFYKQLRRTSAAKSMMHDANQTCRRYGTGTKHYHGDAVG
jgi:hypothetical protein